MNSPDCSTLEAWRGLAQGTFNTIIGDVDADNGTIEVKGQCCIFSTGTNCRDTTNTSATTIVPHSWIAAPLSRALDEAVRRQLPFAMAGEKSI